MVAVTQRRWRGQGGGSRGREGSAEERDPCSTGREVSVPVPAGLARPEHVGKVFTAENSADMLQKNVGMEQSGVLDKDDMVHG